MDCKDVLETLLNLWQNKHKEQNDNYHSDYYCGLIRQFSRVLIEKILIHKKCGSSGN